MNNKESQNQAARRIVGQLHRQINNAYSRFQQTAFSSEILNRSQAQHLQKTCLELVAKLEQFQKSQRDRRNKQYYLTYNGARLVVEICKPLMRSAYCGYSIQPLLRCLAIIESNPLLSLHHYLQFRVSLYIYIVKLLLQEKRTNSASRLLKFAGRKIARLRSQSIFQRYSASQAETLLGVMHSRVMFAQGFQLGECIEHASKNYSNCLQQAYEQLDTKFLERSSLVEQFYQELTRLFLKQKAEFSLQSHISFLKRIVLVSQDKFKVFGDWALGRLRQREESKSYIEEIAIVESAKQLSQAPAPYLGYELVGGDLNHAHLMEEILNLRVKSGYYTDPLMLYRDAVDNISPEEKAKVPHMHVYLLIKRGSKFRRAIVRCELRLVPDDTVRSQTAQGFITIPLKIAQYKGVQETTKQVPALVAVRNFQGLEHEGFLLSLNVVRSNTRNVIPRLGHELLPLELHRIPHNFDKASDEFLYFEVKFDKRTFILERQCKIILALHKLEQSRGKTEVLSQQTQKCAQLALNYSVERFKEFVTVLKLAIEGADGARFKREKAWFLRYICNYVWNDYIKVQLIQFDHIEELFDSSSIYDYDYRLLRQIIVSVEPFFQAALQIMNVVFEGSRPDSTLFLARLKLRLVKFLLLKGDHQDAEKHLTCLIHLVSHQYQNRSRRTALQNVLQLESVTCERKLILKTFEQVKREWLKQKRTVEARIRQLPKKGEKRSRVFEQEVSESEEMLLIEEQEQDSLKREDQHLARTETMRFFCCLLTQLKMLRYELQVQHLSMGPEQLSCKCLYNHGERTLIWVVAGLGSQYSEGLVHAATALKKARQSELNTLRQMVEYSIFLINSKKTIARMHSTKVDFPFPKQLALLARGATWVYFQLPPVSRNVSEMTISKAHRVPSKSEVGCDQFFQPGEKVLVEGLTENRTYGFSLNCFRGRDYKPVEMSEPVFVGCQTPVSLCIVRYQLIRAAWLRGNVVLIESLAEEIKKEMQQLVPQSCLVLGRSFTQVQLMNLALSIVVVLLNLQRKIKLAADRSWQVDVLYWLRLLSKVESTVSYYLDQAYELKMWAINYFRLGLSESIGLMSTAHRKIGYFKEFKQIVCVVLGLKRALEAGQVFLARRLAFERLPFLVDLVGFATSIVDRSQKHQELKCQGDRRIRKFQRELTDSNLFLKQGLRCLVGQWVLVGDLLSEAVELNLEVIKKFNKFIDNYEEVEELQLTQQQVIDFIQILRDPSSAFLKISINYSGSISFYQKAYDILLRGAHESQAKVLQIVNGMKERPPIVDTLFSRLQYFYSEMEGNSLTEEEQGRRTAIDIQIQQRLARFDSHQSELQLIQYIVGIYSLAFEIKIKQAESVVQAYSLLEEIAWLAGHAVARDCLFNCAISLLNQSRRSQSSSLVKAAVIILSFLTQGEKEQYSIKLVSGNIMRISNKFKQKKSRDIILGSAALTPHRFCASLSKACSSLNLNLLIKELIFFVLSCRAVAKCSPLFLCQLVAKVMAANQLNPMQEPFAQLLSELELDASRAAQKQVQRMSTSIKDVERQSRQEEKKSSILKRKKQREAKGEQMGRVISKLPRRQVKQGSSLKSRWQKVVQSYFREKYAPSHAKTHLLGDLTQLGEQLAQGKGEFVLWMRKITFLMLGQMHYELYCDDKSQAQFQAAKKIKAEGNLPNFLLDLVLTNKIICLHCCRSMMQKAAEVQVLLADIRQFFRGEQHPCSDIRQIAALSWDHLLRSSWGFQLMSFQTIQIYTACQKLLWTLIPAFLNFQLVALPKIMRSLARLILKSEILEFRAVCLENYLLACLGYLSLSIQQLFGAELKNHQANKFPRPMELDSTGHQFYDNRPIYDQLNERVIKNLLALGLSQKQEQSVGVFNSCLFTLSRLKVLQMVLCCNVYQNEEANLKTAKSLQLLESQMTSLQTRLVAIRQFYFKVKQTYEQKGSLTECVLSQSEEAVQLGVAELLSKAEAESGLSQAAMSELQLRLGFSQYFSQLFQKLSLLRVQISRNKHNLPTGVQCLSVASSGKGFRIKKSRTGTVINLRKLKSVATTSIKLESTAKETRVCRIQIQYFHNLIVLEQLMLRNQVSQASRFVQQLEADSNREEQHLLVKALFLSFTLRKGIASKSSASQEKQLSHLFQLEDKLKLICLNELRPFYLTFIGNLGQLLLQHSEAQLRRAASLFGTGEGLLRAKLVACGYAFEQEDRMSTAETVCQEYMISQESVAVILCNSEYLGKPGKLQNYNMQSLNALKKKTTLVRPYFPVEPLYKYVQSRQRGKLTKVELPFRRTKYFSAYWKDTHLFLKFILRGVRAWVQLFNRGAAVQLRDLLKSLEEAEFLINNTFSVPPNLKIDCYYYKSFIFKQLFLQSWRSYVPAFKGHFTHQGLAQEYGFQKFLKHNLATLEKAHQYGCKCLSVIRSETLQLQLGFRVQEVFFELTHILLLLNEFRFKNTGLDEADNSRTRISEAVHTIEFAVQASTVISNLVENYVAVSARDQHKVVTLFGECELFTKAEGLPSLELSIQEVILLMNKLWRELHTSTFSCMGYQTMLCRLHRVLLLNSNSYKLNCSLVSLDTRDKKDKTHSCFQNSISLLFRPGANTGSLSVLYLLGQTALHPRVLWGVTAIARSTLDQILRRTHELLNELVSSKNFISTVRERYLKSFRVQFQLILRALAEALLDHRKEVTVPSLTEERVRSLVGLLQSYCGNIVVDEQLLNMFKSLF